jgi:hypothetical protein
MGQRRTTTAVAVALGMGLLSGCGSNDAAPQAAGSSSSSVPASPTATPSTSTTTAAPTTSAPKPTPTKTLAPLSRFEADPAVKAARAFAVQSGRAVNARSMSYKPWLALMTPQARASRAVYIKEDLGQKYPGPLPFTPTFVSTRGNTATIKACVWVQGWGVDPRTGKPARKRQVLPLAFEMKRPGRTWLFNALTDSSGSCDAVTVKGRSF